MVKGNVNVTLRLTPGLTWFVDLTLEESSRHALGSYLEPHFA